MCFRSFISVIFNLYVLVAVVHVITFSCKTARVNYFSVLSCWFSVCDSHRSNHMAYLMMLLCVTGAGVPE